MGGKRYKVVGKGRNTRSSIAKRSMWTQSAAIIAPRLDNMVTASCVSFQKVVNATKMLEMIRCEGFEQREGKRAHYSGHLGSAPPKSRDDM
ncbi:hypothetical protein H5410_060684 [Solanum commersonii]|uniref:Uncharacterized protein n=1 Tax=Solanum commersonii TaxID=4109 RepID=A0A9J5W7A8_SOLCO|nr:hypothetical protein H5410_060684 [Solanum commersonii]